MTDPAPIPDNDAPVWAPLHFWLALMGSGAALAFVVLIPNMNRGGHSGAFSAGLAIWFVTIVGATTSAIVGGVLTAFGKTRLFGTVLLSAGVGGVLAAVLVMSMN